MEFAHPDPVDTDGIIDDPVDRMLAEMNPRQAVLYALDMYERERWDNKTSLEKRTLDEAERVRAREAARDIVAAELFAKQTFPTGYTGAEFLARDIPATLWAVESMIGESCNAILVAQRKAGKTTTLTNYVRSRIDGAKFLGQYESHPIADGSLAVWDLEMGDQQLQSWYARNPPEGANWNIASFRGFTLPFNVPAFEDWAVEWLRSRNVVEWVLDPFSRVMASSGDESDNAEVIRLLETLDRIKMRAGVKRLLIAVHAGKSEESGARGASALEGWADVIMTLSVDNKTGMRTFAAIGRDVEHEAEDLEYNNGTLKLTGPAWMKTANDHAEEIHRLIAATGVDGFPAADLRPLYREMGISNDKGDGIVHALTDQRRVTTVLKGRSKWFVATVPSSIQEGFAQPGHWSEDPDEDR